MAMVKDFAALIFVGTWLLVTLSACETSKHAEIMSTEDLGAQTQEGDQNGIPLDRQSISPKSLDLAKTFTFTPEPPPSPRLPASDEDEMTSLESGSDVTAVAPATRPTPVLPEVPLEFPRGSRGPASDYVPESPPQDFLDARAKGGRNFVDTTEGVHSLEENGGPLSELQEEIVEADVLVQDQEGGPLSTPKEVQIAQLEPSDFVPEVPAPDQEEGSDDAAVAGMKNAPVVASMKHVKDSGLADIFFDYDQYAIRSDTGAVLEKNAELLKNTYENSSVLIEGHCDERGSVDYNLELGKRRAQAVKDYLIDLGVQESRIQIVSYGKEKPFCTESKPSCWQKNRRGHFVQQ